MAKEKPEAAAVAAKPALGIELGYDPYSSEHNPHEIKAHPEGYRLYWCNPNLRARKGWMGWKPVEYDDEIGRNLSDYLPDPPLKMEGTKDFDNLVRRGDDAILCALPIGIWEERQRIKSIKANRRVQSVRGQGNKQYREGVRTYGEGLQDSPRPRQGFMPGADEEPEPEVNGETVRRRLFQD